MDREQEVIHRQMEETRSGLTDKLAALESQVGGTGQAATNAVETTKEAVTGTVEAVTNTVESVKETVETVSEKLHDTVEGVTDSVQQAVEGVKESFEETCKSVAETINLRLQCERHPWAVFGGAVGVGLLGSMLLGGSSRSSRPTRERQSASVPNYPRPAEAPSDTTSSQPERSQNAKQSSGAGLGGAVGGWLWEQLGGLKGLAVGTTMSLVRDLVSQALPENLKEKVTEEVDKLTRSLGGEPVQGSLLPQNQEESQDNGHEQQHYTNPRNGGRSETTGDRTSQPAMAGNQR
jgi:ElaB/YqjD/DUF883 family membrane-anchored ribosome-binding protein